MLLAASFALGTSGLSAASVADPAGEWVGTYTCAQGLTALDLTVEQTKPGRLRAQFHFSAVPSNPKVPEGCFAMTGRFDPGDGHVVLEPDTWLLRPAGFVMVGLDGTLNPDAKILAGRVTDVPACTSFALSNVTPPRSRPPPCHPRGEAIASAG